MIWGADREAGPLEPLDAGGVRAGGLFCGFAAGLMAGGGVFVEAKFPGGAEGAGEGELVGGCEADVGHAVAAPAAGDGEEEVGASARKSACWAGVRARLP